MTSSVGAPGARVEIAPHNCFACGSLNANGLQLDLHVEDGRCWTDLTLRRDFEGWEGIAHGGVITTILDEVMAWATASSDFWGLTARMTVEFKRPVPIAVPVHAEGWLIESRRRLVRTAARIVDPASGLEFATAEGLYVGASDARKRDLKARYGLRWVAADQIGDGQVPRQPDRASVGPATPRSGEATP